MSIPGILIVFKILIVFEVSSVFCVIHQKCLFECGHLLKFIGSHLVYSVLCSGFLLRCKFDCFLSCHGNGNCGY